MTETSGIEQTQSYNISSFGAGKSISWLKEGFGLYRDNLTLLLISSLIAVVLSMCSVFILAGPLSAGLYLITLRLIDKDQNKPEITDVFNGLQLFAETFVFFLISFVAYYLGTSILDKFPVIGGLLSFAFSLCFSGIALFGVLLIVDRKEKAVDALKVGIEIFKQNIALCIILPFITGVAAASGVLLFGFGVFLTMPLYPATIAIAYREAIAPRGRVDQAETSEAKVVSA